VDEDPVVAHLNYEHCNASMPCDGQAIVRKEGMAQHTSCMHHQNTPMRGDRGIIMRQNLLSKNLPGCPAEHLLRRQQLPQHVLERH
jgi:hypothetical protein